MITDKSRTQIAKYKVFEKIRQTIDGCDSEGELQVAVKMAGNFLKMYNNIELYQLLRWYILEKSKTIFNVEY